MLLIVHITKVQKLELLNRADISYSEIDVAIDETGEIIKQNNNDFNWISV